MSPLHCVAMKPSAGPKRDCFNPLTNPGAAAASETFVRTLDLGEDEHIDSGTVFGVLLNMPMMAFL